MNVQPHTKFKHCEKLVDKFVSYFIPNRDAPCFTKPVAVFFYTNKPLTLNSILTCIPVLHIKIESHLYEKYTVPFTYKVSFSKKLKQIVFL